MHIIRWGFVLTIIIIILASARMSIFNIFIHFYASVPSRSVDCNASHPAMRMGKNEFVDSRCTPSPLHGEIHSFAASTLAHAFAIETLFRCYFGWDSVSMCSALRKLESWRECWSWHRYPFPRMNRMEKWTVECSSYTQCSCTQRSAHGNASNLAVAEVITDESTFSRVFHYFIFYSALIWINRVSLSLRH